MNTRHAIGAIAATIASLTAQTVTVGIQALTPVALTATLGTQINQATLQAGPLAPYGSISTSVSTPLTQAHVTVGWAVQYGISAGGPVGVVLAHTLDASAVPGAALQSGTHEFLVEFTASSPAPVSFVVERQSDTSPGTPWPTVDIDIDADGTIDLVNVGFYAHVKPTLTLGAQPVLWRIIMESQAHGGQQSTTSVSIRATANNDALITQTVTGCMPCCAHLDVSPSFVARGLDLAMGSANAGDIRVLVFGFQPQPVLLPSSSGWPCLLLPALDILQVLPTGTAADQAFHLDLPSSVRPVMFHAQGVAVDATGQLIPTDAYAIAAF